MDGSTALAILDKKINSVESTIDTVTLGSDKKSIVITTIDGVSFSVSIPNAVDNPTILNKFTVVNGEVYYDGKRIAEYTEIPTTTSQLTNDSGFITSANLPNLTPYQSKNDSDLNTTNKTVVGAINELKTNINNINIPTKTSQLTNDSGYIINSDIPTIPTKVSQLTNDSNYVTQTEMTDAITDAVTGGTVDLTGYQKSRDTNLATIDKTVVGAINELKDNIDNFEGGGAGLTAEQSQKLETAYEHSQSTHVSASDIPAKVSDLENDSSFVTQTEMTNAINNAQLGGGSTEVDLSIYQTIQEDTLTTTAKTIPEAINELKSGVEGIIVPTKVSELNNDSNFIDKDVSNLTNYPTTTTVENTYAKKTDIPTIPTKVSQLNNDSGFITSIPEEYVTDTELNAKGYLTEHQDISGLQPKSDTALTTSDKTVVGGINEVKNTADDKSKIITLTEAEYKALSNLDPETYYITTDDSTNISTTIDENSTDKEVPSAKTVYTELNKKLDIEEASISNLISFPYDSPTIHENSGITFKVDDEGVIYVSGTKTTDGLVQYYPIRDTVGTSGYLIDTFEVGKTYTLSGCPNGGSASTYRLRILLNYDKSSEGLTPYQYIGVTFTIESEIKYVRIMIDYSGATDTSYGDLVFKPQITEGNKVIDFKPSLDRNNLTQLRNTVSSTINGLNGRMVINSGEDMDNITTLGFYTISSGTTAQTILNLPINSACFIDVYGNNHTVAGTGWMVQEVKASNTANAPIYRRSRVQEGSWGKWQRLCTTSVADVAQTTITSLHSNVTDGNVYYQVKNGICYVDLVALSIGTVEPFKICEGLPKCASKPHCILVSSDATTVLGLVYKPIDDNTLWVNMRQSGVGYCSFSYPVAEE